MIPTQISDYAKTTRRRLTSLEQRINTGRKDLALKFVAEMRRDVDNLEKQTSINVPDLLDPHITPILNYLTQREATVICLRYGLLGFPPQTLDAVGQLCGVTRERVRQLENKAIAKLGHPAAAADTGVFLRRYGLDDPNGSPYRVGGRQATS